MREHERISTGDDVTQKDMNRKYGHKGKFFEAEYKDSALHYFRLYKKNNPNKACFFYPLRDAVMVHESTDKKRKPKDYQTVKEYKIIGYLVSTPDEPDKRETTR